MKRVKLSFALAAALAAPQTAIAQEVRQAGFRISVIVPEVCEIDFGDAIIAGGSNGTVAAQALEYCNSGRSFQVIASHRPLLAGEQVQVSYDGHVRQLDSSGISGIASRSGPIFGNVPITIQSNGLIQNLAISFGIAVI